MRQNTKIHTLVDVLGNPVGFSLTGGQAHDLVRADQLLPGMEADLWVADKAYDADARVREPLAKLGKSTVILPEANSRVCSHLNIHRRQDLNQSNAAAMAIPAA